MARNLFCLLYNPSYRKEYKEKLLLANEYGLVKNVLYYPQNIEKLDELSARAILKYKCRYSRYVRVAKDMTEAMKGLGRAMGRIKITPQSKNN